MKKILYILLTLSILILLSSCILNEKELKKYEDDTKFSKLNTNSRNELVKLIYAAYNQGAGYSYQELKKMNHKCITLNKYLHTINTS